MANPFSNIAQIMGNRGVQQGAPVPTDPRQQTMMQQLGITNPLLQQFGQQVGNLVGADTRSAMQQTNAAVAAVKDPSSYQGQLEIAKAIMNVDPIKGAELLAAAEEKRRAQQKTEATSQSFQQFLATRYPNKGYEELARNGVITPSNFKTYIESDNLTANQRADLYSKYTSASINKYLAGQGDLEPLPKESENKLSAHAKRLLEEGILEGSDEFKQRMQTFNEKQESGIQRTVSQLSPLEAREFFKNEISTNPTWEAMQKTQTKVDAARSLYEGLDKGTSYNVALVQRTVSELYNSDTRAASEIDRLLKNKGIKATFADWVNQSLTGDISEESKQSLKDIVDAAQKLVDQKEQSILKEASALYGDVIDEKSISTVIQALSPSSDSLTDEELLAQYGL